jgi:DNA-binding XRE family transcriptional regulator
MDRTHLNPDTLLSEPLQSFTSPAVVPPKGQVRRGVPPQRPKVALDGQKIRQLRQARALTQAHLARKTGYSPSMIVRAESGGPVSRDAIDAIAEALGVSVKQIVHEERA